MAAGTLREPWYWLDIHAIEKAGKAAVKEAPTFVMTAPSVF